MLRSFTVIDPNLVNLIRENPRYTKMSHKEILGKFVSGQIMAKEVVGHSFSNAMDQEQGNTIVKD
jgi:ABC-type transporter MlaC component